MERSLERKIKTDLDQKIVLLSGPRQVGKTTLAKALYPDSSEYFNMDSEEHRILVRKQAWRRDCDLVIFDELHKIKKWKSWIKGIYDTEGARPRLLVAGSSRLDTYRKGGDSLAGRFYHFRLHPFSVAEVNGNDSPDKALEKIMKVGGFPEPFLKGAVEEAKRWRRSHIDRILREDLSDIASIRHIGAWKHLSSCCAIRWEAQYPLNLWPGTYRFHPIPSGIGSACWKASTFFLL